ncbi:hypothetical protein Y032_0421g1173 [Ancylostoma ceylanicum]|uniref:G-protein coupled receptors family 1 profile domain-containing protein n=1 Tax=Ancylostoma ceylanicum TaxID=53326 RepID=A0A016X153_9BILA|nr:hypothetical protein Y032_0421g1173 [Ancylostoma ceylanicum]
MVMVPLYAQIAVTVVAVCMCFVGLAGNITLLAATIICKELHRKLCYIVAVLTTLHVVCLLCELYMEALQLRFTPMTRDICFRHTFTYSFAMFAQSMMFFMLGMDFLFAIIIPLRHFAFTPSSYVFIMCLPPFLISGGIVFLFFVTLNDDPIEFCTPIQMIPPRMIWILYVVNGSNVAVVALNVIMFIVLKSTHTESGLSVRSSNWSPLCHKKLVLSFMVLTVVFVCSWCFSVMACLLAKRYLSKDASLAIQTYVVVLALPTYCQNYFVGYIRSDRYRNAYRKALHCMLPCIFRLRQVEPVADRVVHPGNPDKNTSCTITS